MQQPSFASYQLQVEVHGILRKWCLMSLFAETLTCVDRMIWCLSIGWKSNWSYERHTHRIVCTTLFDWHDNNNFYTLLHQPTAAYMKWHQQMLPCLFTRILRDMCWKEDDRRMLRLKQSISLLFISKWRRALHSLSNAFYHCQLHHCICDLGSNQIDISNISTIRMIICLWILLNVIFVDLGIWRHMVDWCEDVHQQEFVWHRYIGTYPYLSANHWRMAD